MRRKPTYTEYLAFWLNREREQNRKTYVVAQGAGLAMGSTSPDSSYWEDTSDGDSEAAIKKAQYALRNKND